MEYDAVVELSKEQARQLLASLPLNVPCEVHIYPRGVLITKKERQSRWD